MTLQQTALAAAVPRLVIAASDAGHLAPASDVLIQHLAQIAPVVSGDVPAVAAALTAPDESVLPSALQIPHSSFKNTQINGFFT